MKPRGKHKGKVKPSARFVGCATTFIIVVSGVFAFLADFQGVKSALEETLPPAVEVVSGLDARIIDESDHGLALINPSFSDTLTIMQERSMRESCATQVIITNNFDQEIQLYEMTFECLDTTVDQTPKPTVTFDDSEGSIVLKVLNEGWGRSCATEVIVRLSPEAGPFPEGLYEKRYPIDGIDIGEIIDLEVLPKEFANNMNKESQIKLSIDVVDVQGNSVLPDWHFDWFIGKTDEGKLAVLGKGAGSRKSYAIILDTSQREYSHTEKISESILPKGNISIPICFAPDKSCTIEFKVSFSYLKGNERGVITTEPLRFDKVFEVSSVPGYTSAINLEEIPKDEIPEADAPGIVVSYPYRSLD